MTDWRAGPLGTIDVHAHVYPALYMSWAAELAKRDDPAAALASLTVDHPIIRNDPVFIELDRRVALMDAAGVQTQLLSFASPNLLSNDVEVRSHTVRVFNDAALQAVRAHPGRFGLLANLPLPFASAAVEEIERLAGASGVVGWSVCAHYHGSYLDAHQLSAVWEKLGATGALVYVHPDGFSVPHVLADFGLEWALGAAFDDTILVVRLILSGLVDCHPKICWIIPHLGGTLAVLKDRLDLVWRMHPAVQERLDRPPSDYLSRFIYDTATMQPSAIRFAAETVGAESLVFGSDFPFVHRTDLAGARRVLAEARISDEEQLAILRGNFMTRCSPYVPPASRSLLPDLFASPPTV